MKNTVQLLAALAFLVSCGPAASLTASDTNRETPDLVDRSGAYANTKIDVKDDGNVDIDMTFTAPTCPAADFILEDVRQKVDSLQGVNTATVNLVFEPAWDQSMLSEEARIELGFE